MKKNNKVFHIKLNINQVDEMSEELSIRVLNIGYDFIKEWEKTKKMTPEERFEKTVKNNQYEKRIQKMIELMETLPYTINKLASRAIKTIKLRNLNLNTILIVGTFNFDGATIPYKKHGAMVLGLEVISGYSKNKIKTLVSHELGHVLHLNTYCSHHGIPFCREFMSKTIEHVGKAIYLEGLAVATSREILPNIKIRNLLFYSKEALNWCRENQEKLVKKTINGIYKTGEKGYLKYFTNNDKPEWTPHYRIGYYVGYLAIKKLMERYSLTDLYTIDIEMWEDMIKKALQTIIEEKEENKITKVRAYKDKCGAYVE